MLVLLALQFAIHFFVGAFVHYPPWLKFAVGAFLGALGLSWERQYHRKTYSLGSVWFWALIGQGLWLVSVVDATTPYVSTQGKALLMKIFFIPVPWMVMGLLTALGLYLPKFVGKRNGLG